MGDSNPTLQALAERATKLYSLPAVALEVVRLTDRPDVDTAALTRCIERDPALTVKALRVVNSSLFGLSNRVSTLNQAVALLGTGPLKLLVLRFSLPDQLFAHATKEQLAWYWKTSLTRAVAARQLSQSLWKNAGDEAFLAALLQDVGLLILLRELDEEFARFLGRVIDEKRDLAKAEAETLGFDHRQLTVAMLKRWNLPPVQTEAIGMKRQPARLARCGSPAAELAQVLHLADLVAQLVGGRRISVLPELLEVGKLYRGLEKPMLTDIVAELQPQVDQLADVLSLNLPGDLDYEKVLHEAHQQLAEASEQTAASLLGVCGTESVCDEMLSEVEQLQAALQEFLRTGSLPTTASAESVATEGPGEGARHAAHDHPAPSKTVAGVPPACTTATELLANCVMKAARGCRMQRAELSLLIVEVEAFESLSLTDRDWVSRALVKSGRAEMPPEAEMLRISAGRQAIVLPGVERRHALALAHAILARFFVTAGNPNGLERSSTITFGAGVATATSIFKNFSAQSLVDGAERSLSAARASGGSAVKSIEVF